MNPEMLKFVPDHLKTKKTCNNAAINVLFVIIYVSDRYKTQKMCDKIILENDGI